MTTVELVMIMQIDFVDNFRCTEVMLGKRTKMAWYVESTTRGKQRLPSATGRMYVRDTLKWFLGAHQIWQFFAG